MQHEALKVQPVDKSLPRTSEHSKVQPASKILTHTSEPSKVQPASKVLPHTNEPSKVQPPLKGQFACFPTFFNRSLSSLIYPACIYKKTVILFLGSP